MAEYTREQLLAGLAAANNAGDIEAVNQIANVLAEMDNAPYSAQNMAPSEIASGFSQDISGVASRAQERMSGIMGKRARGEISPLGPLTYGVGEVAIPAATEAVTALGKAGMRAASTVYPDVIEEPIVNAVKNVANYITSTETFQTAANFLTNSLSDYEQYKAEAPNEVKQELRAFESAMDIGLLAAPAVKRVPFEGKIGDLGADITRLGRQQSIENKKEAVGKC